MTLHVVTWNIQKGIGTDFRRDLKRTARVLGALGADLVCLQEVVRQEGEDQAGELAAALGMNLAWGPARKLARGTFGNALLVRGEIAEHRTHDVSVPHMEPRACLEALVSSREHRVRVFVCHFGLGPRERGRQAERLRQIVRGAPRDAPRIVVGDFNEWYRGPVQRALEEELPNVCARLPTHPSPLPLFALDRVAWDTPLRGEVSVLPVQRASDHRLVRVALA